MRFLAGLSWLLTDADIFFYFNFLYMWNIHREKALSERDNGYRP